MTSYLIDKSALARLHLPAVREVLVPLMERGLVFMCGATRAEALFSARNADDRQRLKAQLSASLRWADTPDDLWTRVDELQGAMTAKGQHRSASIADLIVASTADALRLTVLHYDNDIETIAKLTGQPTRWVVPAGSVS
ncbi:PIN domain nuclease [Streptomyces sp. KR80]|uniref:PIN domain nuclease n=1 Tax=Streptomyces sp. KR80 TaxID=3457426 RepID=UPI003FD51E6F